MLDICIRRGIRVCKITISVPSCTYNRVISLFISLWINKYRNTYICIVIDDITCDLNKSE